MASLSAETFETQGLTLAAPSPTRYFDVLLACCARGSSSVLPLLPAASEWRALVDLAEHHGVIPQLYKHLESLSPASSKAFKRLERAHEANMRRALWFTSELKRILARFTEDQIKVLPYKGPLLAAVIYGDIAQRSSYDLDFLIRPKDLARAGQA